jgi:hypothetical protein
MALYFIHVQTPTALIEDVEGFDLPNLSAALAEATDAARELMSEAVLDGRDISDQAMRITNGEGQILARLPFADTLKRDRETNQSSLELVRREATLD